MFRRVIKAIARVILPRSAYLVVRELKRDTKIRRLLADQDIDFRFLDHMIQPSDGIVIDVGAERGEVSRFFVDRGFRVWAVEPSLVNSWVLRLKSLSALVRRRLRIIRVAAGAERKVVSLDTQGFSWQHAVVESGEEQVQMVRLGELIERDAVTSVALLKVDTEGSDIEVLRGYWSSPSIPDPHVVAVEFDRETLGELWTFLREKGYRHVRSVARWNELPGKELQVRLMMSDGIDPTHFDCDFGNLLCAKKSFRVLHPLADALEPG